MMMDGPAEAEPSEVSAGCEGELDALVLNLILLLIMADRQ